MNIHDPSRSSGLPVSVTEICPGTIYALGGILPADARCGAWIPQDVQGFIPFQCYVLRNAGQFLMLDGGLPIHRDEVREGIKALIGGSRERRFMMTRRELDTILNLPWIAHDFQFQKLYCGGDLSPIDFFEKMDDANIDAQIKALVDTPFEFLKPGPIGNVGTLQLEMLRGALMVLPTFWFYELTTRTLFTSDCWGFLPQATPTSPRMRAPSDAEISAERIEKFLGVKFDWLASIDNSPLAKDLKAVFADRPVDRICPNFGCVIEGRDAVERTVEQTLRALESMAKIPRQSALAGWDYQVASR
ncbi:MAG: hypothetical protein QOF09_3130 [Alphaproteobacteria bacterium]|nr:hypothetical protein [Alphaproteobacteria bacterium]